MKFLKFAGVYLGFALLIFTIVIGWNYKEFTTVFENSDGLTEGKELVEKTYSLGGLADYIAESPEMVSVYSSELQTGKVEIQINADVPRPLGALSSVFLTIHALNKFDKVPDLATSSVNIDSVDAYFVPNVYRSIHEKSMNMLRSKMQENGGKLQLKELLPVMTEYNSQAIYDYLLMRFGNDAIQETAQQFGYTAPLQLLPYSGIAIQIHPIVQNKPFEAIYTELSSSDSILVNNVYLSTHSFVHNSGFRKKVQDIFTEHQMGISFLQEKKSYALYTKATPIDLTNMIRTFLKSNEVSKQTKQAFLDILSWPMADRSIKHWFHFYAGIFESRMALSSGIDIAAAQERNDTLIQTVIFDRIPIAFWFHMSSKFINLDYQRRISWDSELRDRSLGIKPERTN
jgi:hypothetical protein